MKMKILVEHIIGQLKEIQDGKAWVGPNFGRRLDRLTEDQAFTRPLPDLHSAAEIISHLTAWRKDTILKIRTGNGSLTEDARENWKGNDELRLAGWDKVWRDYRESLQELIQLLRAKDDSFLKEKYYDPDYKGYYEYAFVINGMLHHDLYHLGQLGIIIKFLKIPVGLP